MTSKLLPRLMTLVAAVTTLGIALMVALAITSTTGSTQGQAAIVIPYGDLAVDREPGARELIARIDMAKARYCAGAGEVRFVDGRAVALDCHGARQGETVRRENAPLLGPATNMSSSAVVLGDR